MQLVPSSFTFTKDIDGDEILKSIESAGRTCYLSDPGDSSAFVRRLIKRGHDSVLEHESASVHIICDRGVSHEVVRHRIASYNQESTRYCNYGDMDIKFILPSDFELQEEDVILLEAIEKHYNWCLQNGRSPQQARYFLPNGLKTELRMTMNMRSWRNFFRLRTAKGAHPDMVALAKSMLAGFKSKIPVVFDDIMSKK